jgi:hypothetical protein
MAEQVQPEPSTDPFHELEQELKQDIDQLIDQGCLSEGFTFGGHSFVIKTLTPNEINAAALAMQRFQGTLREVSAYMQATIGLAIFAFDGDPQFHIRVGDLITHAAKRFEWAGSLDDVIISFVFTKYNALDKRRIRARQAIVNLPTPGQSPSTPWPGSSTEQDIFSVGAPSGNPF